MSGSLLDGGHLVVKQPNGELPALYKGRPREAKWSRGRRRPSEKSLLNRLHRPASRPPAKGGSAASLCGPAPGRV